MAHDLYKNSMVFAGQVPWHGLGTQLPENATWEVISQLGGFYTVGEEKVLTGSGREIPGKKALVRTDTGAPLSVVSDSYKVIQFSQVAETIVEAAQGVNAIFHTAGLLGSEGVRGWLLAELPRVLRVKGDESEIKPYILGTAAHDGKHGVQLKNVATRVVCANTLGSALGESSKFDAVIHHTYNAEARLAEAKIAFTNLIAGMDEFEAYANQLASIKFTDSDMRKVTDIMLPLPVEAEPSTQLENKRETLLSLFETGTGIGAGIRGTAWAGFQALTEFADHGMSTRKDSNGSRRLESIWLGRAAAFKQNGLAAIHKVVSQANA